MTKIDQDELEITRTVTAWDAGKAWAESLKVGDVFLGSYREATLQGFEGRYRSFFSLAALDVLEHKRVMTDMDGVLVEYSDSKEVK